MKLTSAATGDAIVVEARDIRVINTHTMVETSDQTYVVKESVAEVTDRIHRSLVGLD